MATIYDVAQRAGVSPKTVSRVLNGDAPVAEATRAAVEQAMADLSYVPSQAARSIRSKRSGLIGMITSAISGAEQPDGRGGLPELHIVQGAMAAIAKSGKTLLISDSGGDAHAVAQLVRTYREQRVEGLIYVEDAHKPLAEPLPVAGLKTVLVNCYDNAGTPAVLPDDWRGQYELTTRLIAAGHRRLAFLTLDPAMEAARLRLEVFVRPWTKPLWASTRRWCRRRICPAPPANTS